MFKTYCWLCLGEVFLNKPVQVSTTPSDALWLYILFNPLMCFIFMYVQQTSTNIDSLYFCTFNCITFTFTFTVLFDFVRHLEAPWLASTNCTARIHDRAHSVNHQYNPLQTCDLLHDVNKNFANHFYAILWMFSFKLTHIAPLPLRLWTWFASVIISGRSDNFKKSLLSSLKTASALKKK